MLRIHWLLTENFKIICEREVLVFMLNYSTQNILQMHTYMYYDIKEYCFFPICLEFINIDLVRGPYMQAFPYE